ncbi:MAG: toprim domain-containing protein, partial [Acinetobacter sp.]|nr:toprim domain-containing protein [Acinetobacter sp.]
MADLSNLDLSGNMVKEIINEEDPRTAFIGELRSYGFTIKEAVPEIDRIQKFAVPGDKGSSKAGWYWYSEFEDEYRPGAMVGVGVFGNYKDPSQERIVWTSKRKNVMSPTETALFNEQIERAAINRKIEREEAHKRAAIKAQTIWNNADPAPADHEYLVKKGIKPHGARIKGDWLVLSVTVNGFISSLQEIKGDKKKFMFEGNMSGGYYILEADPDGPDNIVYVSESYSTAASINEATGAKVYCAYNANNLLDVTNTAKDQNLECNVIICGDDDIWKDNNTGRTKGIAASEATQCRIVFPLFQDTTKKPTDFNDLHAQEGLDVVQKLIEEKPALYKKKTDYEDMPEDLLSPPGILGDIANYYNVTARAPQPGFAVQTALAIGSIVMGRNYRSTKGNHTSLYFLNIAKSGTGKEHGKTVIEDILSKAGLHDYINGSGYTSAGAVFSALLRMPKHITIIDEFGRYLEAAQGNKNTMLMEANTQLMEAIGRCHGIMRPSSYSTMTLTKEKAKEM